MKYRLVRKTNKGLQIGTESYTYDEACVAQLRLHLVGELFEIWEEDVAFGLK